MKIFKILFKLIILVIVAGILVLGYLGFIPGLSTLMGADKTKDLGIHYTKADYDSSLKKAGVTVEVMKNPGGQIKNSLAYSGKVAVKTDFTQEELSSRLNFAQWRYMPVSNTQLKINNDGTVEFSANILMDRLPGFVSYESMGKYTMADITKGMNFINLIKVNPPFYLKFKAEVGNNKLFVSIQEATIGKFNIPLTTVRADETVTSVFQSIISHIPNFYAQSAAFSEGKLHFEGTLPEKITVEAAK